MTISRTPPPCTSSSPAQFSRWALLSDPYPSLAFHAPLFQIPTEAMLGWMEEDVPGARLPGKCPSLPLCLWNFPQEPSPKV